MRARLISISEGSSGPLVDGYLALVFDEGWVRLGPR